MYVCMYVCMYIYIYIYIAGPDHVAPRAEDELVAGGQDLTYRVIYYTTLYYTIIRYTIIIGSDLPVGSDENEQWPREGDMTRAGGPRNLIIC